MNKMWSQRISYSKDFLNAWRYRLSPTSSICRNTANQEPRSSQEHLQAYPLLTASNIDTHTFVELFGEECKQQIAEEAEQILQDRFHIFDRIEIDAG